MAYSASRGFLANTILSILLPDTHTNTRMKFAVGNALLITGDDFVNMKANQLSYEHEFAREEWEHEFNAIGEIEEYVTYAISRGVPESRARELALNITSEPRMSIPYHLAFELGLLEPPSTRKEIEFALVSGLSHLGGACISEALLSSLHFIRATLGRNIPLQPRFVPLICAIGVVPLLAFRFREIARVKGSRKFELSSLAIYVGCIGATILLGRI